MGAHGWVAGICQPWGQFFYLGAGWPQWKPLGIPGTHLLLKRGSWLIRVYLLLPKLQLPLRRSYLHKICTSAVHIVFHVSFLSPVKVNSTNWPAPNIWVFIAQMVEHCSADAEAMGSMKSRIFFFGFIHICNCLNYNYHCDDHNFM